MPQDLHIVLWYMWTKRNKPAPLLYGLRVYTQFTQFLSCAIKRVRISERSNTHAMEDVLVIDADGLNFAREPQPRKPLLQPQGALLLTE